MFCFVLAGNDVPALSIRDADKTTATPIAEDTTTESGKIFFGSKKKGKKWDPNRWRRW